MQERLVLLVLRLQVIMANHNFETTFFQSQRRLHQVTHNNNLYHTFFYFRHGCALCFCSGVSQQCMSSNLRRKTLRVQFNVPQIVDQVKIYNTSPTGPGPVRYAAAVETEIKPQLYSDEITVDQVERSPSTIYYWSLPTR